MPRWELAQSFHKEGARGPLPRQRTGERMSIETTQTHSEATAAPAKDFAVLVRCGCEDDVPRGIER